MKVAITAQGESLDSQIDPRFGRCSYFILADTEDTGNECIQNENKDAAGGAGIQAAQQIAEKGTEALITGNVGPKAYETLESAGIDIYQAEGSVEDALEDFKKDDLKKIEDQTVPSHHGESGGKRQGGKGKRGGKG